MYIRIDQDFECSKCKALNNYENVSRKDETLIRCRNCGHEKVTSKTTYTENTEPLTYIMKLDEKQFF